MKLEQAAHKHCAREDLGNGAGPQGPARIYNAPLIRERCNVVSPQEGVGSAREIWGVEAREGEHLAVTCRFLGDVEVDGSAGCFTVRCVR